MTINRDNLAAHIPEGKQAMREAILSLILIAADSDMNNQETSTFILGCLVGAASEFAVATIDREGFIGSCAFAYEAAAQEKQKRETV